MVRRSLKYNFFFFYSVKMFRKLNFQGQWGAESFSEVALSD